MDTIDQQARASISVLVRHVFDHRNDLVQGIPYETLALSIGRLNKHGMGHPRGMGPLLSRLGHLLREIDDEWGTRVPQLQSLVVLKNGKDKDLPSDGISEFWADYPKLSRTEKMNRVRVEWDRIAEFGSRWNDVLAKLAIPKIVKSLEPPLVQSIRLGRGGESPQHKNFKEYVKQHPEIVGATRDWIAIEEYALPSGDQIDVVFKSEGECVAVEVKATISDALPTDYERGIYQTIKYGAVLKAMSLDRTQNIPRAVQSVLVLESTLPSQYRGLAQVLCVTVIENAREMVTPKPKDFV